MFHTQNKAIFINFRMPIIIDKLNKQNCNNYKKKVYLQPIEKT